MDNEKRKEVRDKNVILIPTDFSEVGENAINHGLGLAQLLKYKICILHVITPQNGNTNKADSPGIEEVRLKLNKYREAYEGKYRVKIDIMTREGNIFKVINEVAAEIGAGLMVMGTHGKQGLQHLYGSYALKVVLDCPCPAIVVQKRMFEKGYRNIVLPIGNGIEAGQAVELLAMMHALFASEIHLLQLTETDPDQKERLKGITQQITRILDEKKVPWKISNTGLSTDFPVQVIAHAVEKRSDLIIIMSMPGENATGYSFSSWNEPLMFNEAQIPVMLLNPVDPGGQG
jgi:nucleotide-binding universal stress UspA family protein